MSQPVTEPTATAPTPVTPPAAPPEVKLETTPAYTPPASQADLDRIIADRLSREKAKFADYADLQKKAAEYDKAQDAAKSDLQKANERAEKAEAEAASAKREAFAATKGVPSDLITGTTPEQWEAAADRALAWKGQQVASPPAPSYAHALGNTGPGMAGGDIDAQIAEAEKARNFALSIQLKQKKAAQSASRT